MTADRRDGARIDSLGGRPNSASRMRRQRLAGRTDDGRADQVGLRRNPRRAQLLVSTVLGKHLPADPRVIAGTGRLLGALVARALPTDWTSRRAGVLGRRCRGHGVRAPIPAALLDLLDTDRRPGCRRRRADLRVRRNRNRARASRRRPAGIGLSALHPAAGRLRAGRRRVRRAAFARHRSPAATRTRRACSTAPAPWCWSTTSCPPAGRR